MNNTQPASVAPKKNKKDYKTHLINLLSILFLATLLGIGHYLTHPKPEHRQKLFAYTPLVSVHLVAKRNKDGVNGQQLIEFDLSYINLCARDIAGVSGQLLVNDSNDNTLLPLKVEFNKSIPATGTVLLQSVSTPKMQGLAGSRKLWDADFAHLHSSFRVSEVRFSDGSRITFPGN